MLRGLSNVRRRVEQPAGSGRCSGDHRIHRIVHVRNDDPTPPWPERDKGGRCACGAELEYFSIVHQHAPDAHPVIPDDRPESSVVH